LAVVAGEGTHHQVAVCPSQRHLGSIAQLSLEDACLFAYAYSIPHVHAYPILRTLLVVARRTLVGNTYSRLLACPILRTGVDNSVRIAAFWHANSEAIRRGPTYLVRPAASVVARVADNAGAVDAYADGTLVVVAADVGHASVVHACPTVRTSQPVADVGHAGVVHAGPAIRALVVVGAGVGHAGVVQA